MKLSRETGILAGNVLAAGILLAFVAGMTLATWALSLRCMWGAVLAAALMVGWVAASFAAVNWLASRLETEDERRARLGDRR